MAFFIFSRVHMAPGVSHIFVKDLQTLVRLGDVGFSVRVPSCKGRRVVQRRGGNRAVILSKPEHSSHCGEHGVRPCGEDSRVLAEPQSQPQVQTLTVISSSPYFKHRVRHMSPCDNRQLSTHSSRPSRRRLRNDLKHATSTVTMFTALVDTLRNQVTVVTSRLQVRIVKRFETLKQNELPSSH